MEALQARCQPAARVARHVTQRCTPAARQRRWRHCWQAAGGDGSSSAADEAQPSSSAAPSSSSSSGQPPSQPSNPWELLGRVVREERIALQFDDYLNTGLIRSAAARESGLGVEEFEALLQRLLTLMPFLQSRIIRMQPKLLAALAADPDRLAARLIQLRSLLPAADVAGIVAQRPSLLLDGEWARVPAGAARLAALYSEEEVARLAGAEPVLLVEDVDEILAEIARLMPQQDAAAALLARPGLATSVGRLSHLSL